MNIQKKTIFLTNNEKSKGMASLILESRNNNIFGTIKVYSNVVSGDYVLGIKCKDKIIKQNIKMDSKPYNFLLSDRVNLSDTLGCVVLKVDGTSISPTLWGSEKSENYKGKIISTLRDNISKLSRPTPIKRDDRQESLLVSSKTTSPLLRDLHNENRDELLQKSHESIAHHTEVNNQSTMRSSQKDFVPSHPRRFENKNLQLDNIIRKADTLDIENTSTQQFDNHNAEEVYSPIRHQIEIDSIPKIYSQISLDEEIISKQNVDEIAIARSTAQLFESDEDEIENLIDNELKIVQGGKHKFYDMIADQLNELFERYPREDNLCKLIDNSRWVKIDTDIDNNYHVVGIIMHNNDIKYICYGVPGQYNNEPPIEMREYSQWLPTDTNDPYNKGYWVMYQDADTGENIKVN